MRRNITVICALISMSLFIGCSKKGAIDESLTHVTVANPQKADVTDFMEFTGTVGAVQNVTIVARVEGYLDAIHFQDGTYVKKGTSLFTIQQEEYIQQLKLYQAQLTYSSEEYERQMVMIKKNATSEASVQQYYSQKEQGEANVALAKLNLGYTEMYAPFDGLLGEHQVDVGNLVGNSPMNPTQLVTIEQIIPIYVNFSINTRDALKLRQMMRAAGMADKSAVNNTPVFAQLENESDFPHKGTLDFANNSVDTSSGTIQLRGVFPNADRTMFPGLFSTIRIPLGPPKPGLVVPNAVVLSDQQGDFVFVVNAKDIVERRSVEKGPLNGTERAISKGLEANDRVVVNGIPNIRVGLAVNVALQVNPSPTPSPKASPASK
ncbi:MAG: efflux RND transporter periplasmic adaptor subunit [Chthoniobacterales bacterium]